MPPFDQTPDKPQSFGFKVSWFAIKASGSQAVLEALELGQGTPANWASGLEAAYSTPDPWLFVSPPIDGWVLVIGGLLPYPVTIDANRDIGKRFDVLFSRLMKRFDDVQFFGSYRVVSFVTWARALDGEPTRILGIADGDGLANFGEQTPEEAKLGFANVNGLSPADALDKMFDLAEEREVEEKRLVASGMSPREARAKLREKNRYPVPDEEDVVDLAAAWGIDPLKLSDQDHPPCLGLAVRLPDDLRQ